MDTNVVWPTGPNTCDVAFDWWVERNCVEDAKFIQESLKASDIVQQEDVALCESVQRGMESVGFRRGRYAPSVEMPMFHFHQLLHHHYKDHAS
jgi:choline monooxygenase